MLSWIWKKADGLVSRHKTTNPFELADACNYYIRFEENMPVWGCFIRTGKRSGMITISDRLSQHMKYLVAAHELAHGVLGHKNNVDNEFFLAVRWFNMVKEERQANLFAVHLLSKGYDWSHGDIKLAAKETGLPYQLVQEYVLTRGLGNLNRHQRRTSRDNHGASFFYNIF